jgi:hypothetical protein
MTDRELLELAAKAAGLHIDKSKNNGGGAANTGFDIAGNAVLDWHNNKTWNPLTDDGDALRLAVRKSVFAVYYALWLRFFHEELSEDKTPSVATRRAIVRVAAEIGKEMK